MASTITSSAIVAPVAVQRSEIQASSSAKVAPVRAFNGLKAANLFTKVEQPALTVSNGYTTSAMMVWTPINNKFFETLSFLPPLSDMEIARQVEYIVKKGWTPCLEFAAPENAFTLTHGPSDIVSSANAGYYDNRYWTMWKLPMFGCTDPSQVLREVNLCTAAFPDAYVRIAGFDNVKQVQCASFIVHRPYTDPAIPPTERSV